MHVERAVVRVRDRTRTFPPTSECLKRHDSPPKKREEGRNIRGWVFPSYCTFPVQRGSGHSHGKWWKRCKYARLTQLLLAVDLWPTFKSFTQDFWGLFLCTLMWVLCSGDSRDLWFLQRVVGRPTCRSPRSSPDININFNVALNSIDYELIQSRWLLKKWVLRSM